MLYIHSLYLYLHHICIPLSEKNVKRRGFVDTYDLIDHKAKKYVLIETENNNYFLFCTIIFGRSSTKYFFMFQLSTYTMFSDYIYSKNINTYLIAIFFVRRIIKQLKMFLILLLVYGNQVDLIKINSHE